VTEEIVMLSFLFFDIEQELFAIEDFRVAMERQLPIVAKNETDRYYEEAAQHDEEAVRHGMEQWAHMFSEETLPRLFRSQILVTLWAVYEAAIDEIGEHLRRRGGHSLKPDNFRGGKLDRLNSLAITPIEHAQHVMLAPETTQEVLFSRSISGFGNR
jgi:hypothetical protein